MIFRTKKIFDERDMSVCRTINALRLFIEDVCFSLRGESWIKIEYIKVLAIIHKENYQIVLDFILYLE